MNLRPGKMTICYNILSGSIRILSANGRFEYKRIWEPDASKEQRIKDLVVLLKIVRKLQSPQTTLAATRRKLIEAQLNHR
jgi:hypothetical protein